MSSRTPRGGISPHARARILPGLGAAPLALTVRQPRKVWRHPSPKNRRRVDDHVIVKFATAPQGRVHRPGAQHLCREGGRSLGRSPRFGISGAPAFCLFSFVAPVSTVIGRSCQSAEPVMNVRPAKVAIGQQNTLVSLGRAAPDCWRRIFLRRRRSSALELRRMPMIDNKKR
jgi:hypothetical protein